MDRFLAWWESDSAHVLIFSLTGLAIAAMIYFQI